MRITTRGLPPTSSGNTRSASSMSNMQRASTMEVAAEQHWLHDTDPLQLKGKGCCCRIGVLRCSVRARMRFAGHTGRVFDVAFCPVYSGLLASASDDNSVRFWGIDDTRVPSTGRQIGKCNGHTDSVLRITWQSDGQLLSTGTSRTCITRSRRALHSSVSLGVCCCSFCRHNCEALAGPGCLRKPRSAKCLRSCTKRHSQGDSNSTRQHTHFGIEHISLCSLCVQPCSLSCLWFESDLTCCYRVTRRRSMLVSSFQTTAC